MPALTFELDLDGLTYAYRVERAEGVWLSNGEGWRGYRVGYRQAGARPWRNVLLVEHDHWPNEQEISEAIRFHRERRPRG